MRNRNKKPARAKSAGISSERHVVNAHSTVVGSVIPTEKLTGLPQPIVPEWFTPSLLRGMRHQQMLNQPAFPSAIFDQIIESRYPSLTAAAIRYAAYGPDSRCPIYEGPIASVPADIAELMAIVETTSPERAIASVAGWVPCSDNRLYNLDMAQIQSMMAVSALRTRARCMKALSARHQRAALPPEEREDVAAHAAECKTRSEELADVVQRIRRVREALGVTWTPVDVRRPSGPWVRKSADDETGETTGGVRPVLASTIYPAGGVPPTARMLDTQTMDLFQDVLQTGEGDV